MKKAFFLPVLLIILVSAFFIPASAQQLTSYNGKLQTEEGEPVSGAIVEIKSLKAGGVTDIEGTFHLEQVPPGDYELHIRYLGKVQTEKIHVIPGGIVVPLVFKQQGGLLQDVTITGLTENEKVNRQAYNVTSVDATKLHNTTLDLAHTLDRVAGVRVREVGGVGSNISLSINGLSGRQIKMFIDGIPMDDFGSSFQINNIPVNQAERIEIYKGVVPIWLGSDALGGAVNIVTGNKKLNYIDASYSFGSFNTHKTAINAAITSKKGLTLQINAYQNYSDNNYKIKTDVADLYTGAYTEDVTLKRFHDTYHNEMLIANVGFVNKPWADRLLIGMTMGQSYKEIQSGARMAVVYGQWYTKGNIVMPTLRYQKKDLIIKGLDVSVNANINVGKEQNVDTAFRDYTWTGQYRQWVGNGGESAYSLYKYSNNLGIATSTISYAFSRRHSVALSNTFTSFNRKGFNSLEPSGERYAQPQKSVKNVSGISYRYDLNALWSTTVFGKYFYQDAHTGLPYTISGVPGTQYLSADNKTKNGGYGIATSYYITPHLQAKTSYERTNRLPDNTEMFGDLINTEANFSLKPERSHNFNLGFTYSFSINTDHRFSADVSGIYRDAKDYIRYRLNNNQTKTVADNVGGVRTKGGEAELMYSYKNFLVIDANITYMDIRNMVKYEPGYTGVSLLYKKQLPNLPYLFGHLSTSVFFNNVVSQGDKLSFGYYLLYVNEFWLTWPDLGGKKVTDDKRVVPTQLGHDINMVYSMKNGKYNIALECRNLTDALLYDNFSLQKPSRSFNIKLRYYYSR